MTAIRQLFTVVQNGVNREATFGFLGPRGMRLAANEVVSIRGDLIANIGVSTQFGRNRQFDSMRRALALGRLIIRSRPAPIVYDATLLVPKTYVVINNVLSAPTLTNASYT